MNVVLAGQAIADAGEQQDQRQVMQAKVEVGSVAVERQPAGFETDEIGCYPGGPREDKVPAEKPNTEQLTVAVDHRRAHPWRACRPLVRGGRATRVVWGL